MIFYAAIPMREPELKAAAATTKGFDVAAARSPQLQAMPSATGGIARLVWARLREAGIQADGLLSKARLTLEQIQDRKARLSVESQIKFLELGAEALHDDALGFHLARDFDLREIGLLYYVAASSGQSLKPCQRRSAIAASRTREFHCDLPRRTWRLR